MKTCTASRWLLATSAIFSLVSAQTSTKCNPLTSTCQADPALGHSISIDLTSESKEFTASGSPSYNSDGAHLAVAKAGDSPTLTSNWYLMFGHVEVVMKPAPGVGIVSSMVMQSDDLDEIDFEWLGADNQQVQSNYFGKGQTTSYNRGAFHPNPSNQDDFHTYTVDWTADQIVWQIDGTTVRALTPQSAEQGQYPQTPMQLKLGIWSGGDSSNAPGTVQWAGGATNYGGGPYNMVVKSVKASDYSTGTSYTYGDSTGTWQSIKSNGGTVNSGGSPGAMSSAAAAAPRVTDVSSGAPAPFDPSHNDRTVSRSSVWPWVATATTVQTAVATQSTIPGLPSGWTVSSSGKVVPPSSAPSTPPPVPSPSSPPASPPAAGAGSDVSVGYDEKGFPVTITLAPGYASATKVYDNQGFLVTPVPRGLTEDTTTFATRVANKAQASGSASASGPSAPTSSGAAGSLHAGVAAAVGVLAGAMVL